MGAGDIASTQRPRALDDKLRRDELEAILDQMDAERGIPSKQARQWAKKVLAPSSSTRAR